MEERGTDARILMLIYSVLNYFEAKKEPVNPFVKGFGVTEKVHETELFMNSCLTECAEYFPEVLEMLDAMQSKDEENINIGESQAQ